MAIEVERPNIDIGIVCSDFEASLHFYRDVLGLDVFAEVQVPAEPAIKFGLAPRGFRHVGLKAGDTLIKLMDIESPPPGRSEEFAAGVRWLTFFVSDVKATYKELKGKGARSLSEPAAVDSAVGEDPVAGVVCAVDPDGLLIEFVQL